MGIKMASSVHLSPPPTADLLRRSVRIVSSDLSQIQRISTPSLSTSCSPRASDRSGDLNCRPLSCAQAQLLGDNIGVFEFFSRFFHSSSRANSSSNCIGGSIGTRRESIMLGIVVASACLTMIVAPPDVSAENDLGTGFRTFEDVENRFRISIPQEWLVGEGETSSINSVTAFYPEEASDSNVSVAITSIGPDFTQLGSLGKVDAFAEKLVNSLDRSWIRPPGLAAKLIDSRAANGLYYIEYTLQNPGERLRHILSAIGMASNGWYNRLYTVTGQFTEDESDKYGTSIEKAVSSFRLL